LALILREGSSINESCSRMKLVIAIPTFNRCEKLRRNIESIDRQIIPDGVELSLAISNSASTDSTQHFLRELSAHRSNICLFNQQTGWTGGNYGYLETIIPEQADWVWCMGDDDYFPEKNSLASMCEFLKKNDSDQDFVFVHACQAQSQVFKSDVLSLCNGFGYIEMFGWISSIVMRAQPFKKALRKIDKRVQVARTEPPLGNSQSAFFHSSYLLEEIYDKKGAFIDLPFIEPQDELMTEDTRRRWQNENMGERYIYVVDDLMRLREIGLPLTNLPSQFFKYHKYHLWDRFINYQISATIEVVQKKDPNLNTIYKPKFLQNWRRIESMATMLDKSEIQKWLIVATRNAQALCDLLFINPDDKNILGLLTETRKYLTLGCYDYKIDHSENQIFRTEA
jgi:glycosyltransferase involved in cell wall biosynthesis